jgi:phage-related minor tail protein
MATLATLLVKLGLDAGGFKKGADEAARAAGGLNGVLGTIGKVLPFAAAAGAVAGLGKVAFDAGQTMDEAFDTIVTKTGATGAALEQLKADTQGVFTSIPTDATRAASALSELHTRLGITGQALTDLGKPLLEVSRLTGGDATTNAQLFTRVMGDWSVPVAEGAGTLDKLFKMQQTTGASMEGLMQKVVQFGSPMRLMGFSLDEAIALFGKWEKEGVNAELVMGSLRIAAGKFANESSEAAEALGKKRAALSAAREHLTRLQQQLQVATLRQGEFGAKTKESARVAAAMQIARLNDDIAATQNSIAGLTTDIGQLNTAQQAAAAGGGKSLRDNLLETFDAIKNNTDASQALALGMDVFGARAGPDMVAAIREGRFAIDDLVAALGDADGAIMQTAEKTMDFPEKLDILRNKLTTWLAPVGLQMMDAITQAVDWIMPRLDQVVGWVQANWPRISAIAMQVFGAVQNVISQVVGWVQANWPRISAIAMQVFGAVQGVIGQAMASIQGLFQGQGGGIGGTWADTWTRIQTVVMTALPPVLSIIRSVLTAIGTFLANHGAEIQAFIGGAWQTISQIVNVAVQIIAATVIPALRMVAAFLAEHGAEIQAFLGNTWTFISTLIETALNTILGVLRVALALFKGDWAGAWLALQETARGLWDGIKTIILTALAQLNLLTGGKLDELQGWFVEKWNDITAFLRGIDLAEIGRGMIQGMVNGIKSMAGALVAAARDTVNDAINAAKNLLGIKSPSVVFMGIGQAMMLGAQTGVERAAGGVVAALQAALQPGDVLARWQEALETAAGQLWQPTVEVSWGGLTPVRVAAGGGTAQRPAVFVSGDSYSIVINDQAAAALTLAMIDERRNRRLNQFMGA